MRLVEEFTEEEFRSLLRDGVALTTLERLATAPREIKAALVQLAIEVKDDQAVVDALRKWQAEQRKAELLNDPVALVKMLTGAAQKSLLERLTGAGGRERRGHERDGEVVEDGGVVEALLRERAGLQAQVAGLQAQVTRLCADAAQAAAAAAEGTKTADGAGSSGEGEGAAERARG